VDLASNDWGTILQCEDISHKRFCITMNFDNICYLNDRVSLRLWEFPFLSRAFDIERKDSKGSYRRMLIFTGEANGIIEVLNINFNLTV